MPLLRWRQGDKYHQRSACGRYSVCVAFVGPEAVYEAWQRVAGTPPVLIVRAPRGDKPAMKAAAEKCKAACQAHANDNEPPGEPAKGK